MPSSLHEIWSGVSSPGPSVSVMDYIPASKRSAIRNGTSDYDCSAALLAMRDDVINRGSILFEWDSGLYRYTHNGFLIGIERQRHIGEGAKLQCVSTNPWSLQQNCLILNPSSTCFSGDSTAFHGRAINTVSGGANAVTLKNVDHAADFAIGDWIMIYSLTKMIPSDGEVDPWQIDFVQITGIAGAVLTFANHVLAYGHRDDFPISPSTGAGPAKVYQLSGKPVPSQISAHVGYQYVGMENSFIDVSFEGMEFLHNPNMVLSPNYYAYMMANNCRSLFMQRCKAAEVVFSYGIQATYDKCVFDAVEMDKAINLARFIDCDIHVMRNATGVKKLELVDTAIDMLPADCEELVAKGCTVRNKNHSSGRCLWFGLSSARRVDIEGGVISTDSLFASGLTENLTNFGKSLEIDGTIVTISGGKIIIPVFSLVTGETTHTEIATWVGACREGGTIEWAKGIYGGWPTSTWVGAKSKIVSIRVVSTNVEITLDHRGLTPVTGWRAIIPHYEVINIKGSNIIGTVPAIPYRGDHPQSEPNVIKFETLLDTAAYYVVAPKGVLTQIDLGIVRAGTNFVQLQSREDDVAINLTVDATQVLPRRLTQESVNLHVNDIYLEGGVAKTKITSGLFSGTLFFHPASTNAGGGPGGFDPATGALARLRLTYSDLL